jgi:hypothetical protein
VQLASCLTGQWRDVHAYIAASEHVRMSKEAINKEMIHDSWTARSDMDAETYTKKGST